MEIYINMLECTQQKTRKSFSFITRGEDLTAHIGVEGIHEMTDGKQIYKIMEQV